MGEHGDSDVREAVKQSTSSHQLPPAAAKLLLIVQELGSTTGGKFSARDTSTVVLEAIETAKQLSKEQWIATEGYLKQDKINHRTNEIQAYRDGLISPPPGTSAKAELGAAIAADRHRQSVKTFHSLMHGDANAAALVDAAIDMGYSNFKPSELFGAGGKLSSLGFEVKLGEPIGDQDLLQRAEQADADACGFDDKDEEAQSEGDEEREEAGGSSDTGDVKMHDMNAVSTETCAEPNTVDGAPNSPSAETKDSSIDAGKKSTETQLLCLLLWMLDVDACWFRAACILRRLWLLHRGGAQVRVLDNESVWEKLGARLLKKAVAFIEARRVAMESEPIRRQRAEQAPSSLDGRCLAMDPSTLTLEDGKKAAVHAMANSNDFLPWNPGKTGKNLRLPPKSSSRLPANKNTAAPSTPPATRSTSHVSTAPPTAPEIPATLSKIITSEAVDSSTSAETPSEEQLAARGSPKTLKVLKDQDAASSSRAEVERELEGEEDQGLALGFDRRGNRKKEERGWSFVAFNMSFFLAIKNDSPLDAHWATLVEEKSHLQFPGGFKSFVRSFFSSVVVMAGPGTSEEIFNAILAGPSPTSTYKPFLVQSDAADLARRWIVKAIAPKLEKCPLADLSNKTLNSYMTPEGMWRIGLYLEVLPQPHVGDARSRDPSFDPSKLPQRDHFPYGTISLEFSNPLPFATAAYSHLQIQQLGVEEAVVAAENLLGSDRIDPRTIGRRPWEYDVDDHVDTEEEDTADFAEEEIEASMLAAIIARDAGGVKGRLTVEKNRSYQKALVTEEIKKVIERVARGLSAQLEDSFPAFPWPSGDDLALETIRAEIQRLKKAFHWADNLARWLVVEELVESASVVEFVRTSGAGASTVLHVDERGIRRCSREHPDVNFGGTMGAGAALISLLAQAGIRVETALGAWLRDLHEVGGGRSPIFTADSPLLTHTPHQLALKSRIRLLRLVWLMNEGDIRLLQDIQPDDSPSNANNEHIFDKLGSTSSPALVRLSELEWQGRRDEPAKGLRKVIRALGLDKLIEPITGRREAKEKARSEQVARIAGMSSAEVFEALKDARMAKAIERLAPMKLWDMLKMVEEAAAETRPKEVPWETGLLTTEQPRRRVIRQLWLRLEKAVERWEDGAKALGWRLDQAKSPADGSRRLVFEKVV